MGGAIGGLVGGIFGGNSAPSAPNVNVYQPSGTGNVDSQLQGLLTSNTNLVGQNNPYNQLSPQILQAFQSLFSNPNAGGYQTGANNAGTAYGSVGNQGVASSSPLNTAALGILPGAQSVMNLGLDPQSALYNQMLQRTNDQANVTNAQQGLTGQQAAGNVNQADTNFNIDWQNNQLQRAIAGLGAGSGAVSNASTASNTANNIGGTGAANILAGGAAPYNTGQTIGGNQETALMQYLSQLLGPSTSSQSTISDLGSYLGQGINASTAGQNAALNDYYAQLQGAADASAGGSEFGLGLNSAAQAAFPATLAFLA